MNLDISKKVEFINFIILPLISTVCSVLIVITRFRLPKESNDGSERSKRKLWRNCKRKIRIRNQKVNNKKNW